MKTILSILTILFFSNIVISQTTSIPDANFEQALINLGYDNVLDDSVTTSNINTVINLNVICPGHRNPNNFAIFKIFFKNIKIRAMLSQSPDKTI